ncbi:MAG: hypothetical protein OEV94_02885 [Deltaproteobacteria bacterium]|nr:hypothetical protein [Deltaproteobacteria bacterium]
MKWILFPLMLGGIWSLWWWYGKRNGMNLVTRVVVGALLGFILATGVFFFMVRTEFASRGALGSIQLNPIMTADEQTTANKALRIFLKEACPALNNKYWPDVARAYLTFSYPTQDRVKTLGWNREVRLKVSFSAKPESLPPTLELGGKAVDFFLGGPGQAGVVFPSPEGQRLCGLTPDPQKPVRFMAVEHMALVAEGAQDPFSPHP